MEPSLKINENEYKPLSHCDRSETYKLQDQLLEKINLAMNFTNPTLSRQLTSMLSMVEERLHFFDIGYYKEYAGKKKKIRKKISLLDDDD